MKRYATIDIGSNTILLLIAQIDPQGAFEVIQDGGETTRLARGLQKGGKLDPLSVKKSIAALKRFSSQCKQEEVQDIACVGTNALRMAQDVDGFIRHVQEECGISIRVISEDEEARLSYLSVQHDPLMTQDAVVMDVGGGSSEYIFRYKEGSTDQVQTISLPLGAVCLTEKFLHTDPPSHVEVKELQTEITKTLLRISAPLEDELVGIGGTAATLASMHLGLDVFDRDKIHGLQLPIGALREQVRTLQETDLEARRAIKGLPPDRADIILAGAMIILAAMDKLNKKTIHISSHGLRYGLFYQRFMSYE